MTVFVCRRCGKREVLYEGECECFTLCRECSERVLAEGLHLVGLKEE
jgi:hypothetical protein